MIARMENVDLDALASDWRGALDAAEDTLDALGRSCRALHFSPMELRDLVQALAHERQATNTGLRQLARTTHTHLHRSMTGPRADSELLGLGTAGACVFDLDGILTASAALHAAAWQDALDELLVRHYAGQSERYGPFRAFSPQAEYFRYFHGRPRLEGLSTFLSSRGIRLPDGSPGDPAGAETAFGLANSKNQALRRRLAHAGVEAYEGSFRYLELAHEAGLRCAVVSASANTKEILGRSGVGPVIDVVVDGNVMEAERLRPKPEPDSVLAACNALGASPSAVATFEATSAGIAASRAAEVGRVIVVDREGRRAANTNGADRVVSDLTELIDPILGCSHPQAGRRLA
jgi:beta-phosphoglucomutase-like phosphatase (HAD superfamily)